VTDYLATNQALWTVINADYTDGHASVAWSERELTWGLFAIPERELNAIGDVNGRDVVELGCGSAYFSAHLARLGARMVAVDVTRAQLATARRCQREFDLAFPLIQADAERVPLRDKQFDVAVSEYGASLWCNPEHWTREAARLLRPGGLLTFLTNSVLATLCVPEEEGVALDRLMRPQRGLNRVQWPDGGTEFHPSHSDWIRILRANGFEIEALHELYAPIEAQQHEFYEIASPEWAAQWPVEDVWVARLTGDAPVTR
jgi:SAM-dependent methyltransferase